MLYRVRAAHLPFINIESVWMVRPLQHGQCKHTVTFPAALRHRLLTGTKLLVVTEAEGCEQLAQSRYAAAPATS